MITDKHSWHNTHARALSPSISRRHDDAAPGGARVEPPRVGSQAGHEATGPTTRPRVRVVSAERFPGGGDKESRLARVQRQLADVARGGAYPGLGLARVREGEARRRGERREATPPLLPRPLLLPRRQRPELVLGLGRLPPPRRRRARHAGRTRRSPGDCAAVRRVGRADSRPEPAAILPDA